MHTHASNSQQFDENYCIRKPSSGEDSSIDLPRISKKRIVQASDGDNVIISKLTKPGKRYFCRINLGEEQSERMEYFRIDRNSDLVPKPTTYYKSGKRHIFGNKFLKDPTTMVFYLRWSKMKTQRLGKER